MRGQEPQVSVGIPTYNRAGMLRESIESVLTQTFPDFELIISDNASQDATESVVRSFSDPRIRYARNATNLGHRANMNQCLRLARGRYITILFDDDMMMPENLAAKVEVLAANPDVGLVHSKYHIIDDQGRIIEFNTTWGHGPDRTVDGLESREEILCTPYNTINAPAVLFRRACYEKLGGFAEQVRLAFDYEYWMRIAVYYPVAFLAQPLIKWRIHAGSLTNVHLGESQIQKLKEVLAAKRLIVKNHSRALPAELKRKIWRQMSLKVVEDAETMLGDGGPNPEARAFVLHMCRTFPELLREKEVWKVLLKTVLSRRTVERLKRISPL